MPDQCLSRRSVITRLVAAAAVASLVAACAPRQPANTPAPVSSASSASSASTAAPTQANGVAPIAATTPVAAQPKKGGTLTLGQTAPVVTTDPYPSNDNSTNLRQAFFNMLVQVDEKGTPQPDLAESWVTAEDGLGITFKLRQGVKFHNGKDFTAEEAKWSVEWAQNPKSLAQAVGELQGVKITATDKYTLDLKFPTPLPEIFSLLVGVPMIEPSSDLKKAVIGTGPFKLESLAPGDQISLTRNPTYWRQGYPLLDKYVIKAIPDANSLVINLQSGAVQAIFKPPLNQAKQLSSGSTKVINLPAAGNFEFLPSTVDKPFSDQKVRQAMDYAIDRKRFAATILYGFATPAYTMWPKGSPGYFPALDTGDFNLDKAKQMIADAGYPNGFSTSMVCSTESFPELTTICQAFQSDLAKIGVKMTIDDQEASRYVETVRFGRYTGMAAHGYGFGDQDPALIFLARPFDPNMNPARFKSDEYKKLILEGKNERDPAKRQEIYQQITQFVRDQAFVLPIATVPRMFAFRANVQGFKYNANKEPNFEETWLA